MKNNLSNTFKKSFNLSKKKLIEQPLIVLKKITSLSLKEKYNSFKKNIKQKEKKKIKKLKKK